MRRHHKRGTARFGCLRRFCLSTHSESFGVIRWPECDCVCAGVGLSGGWEGQAAHPRAPGQCLHFECRGAPARVRVWRCEGRPPLPHHFVCVEEFTLPYLTSAGGAGSLCEYIGHDVSNMRDFDSYRLLTLPLAALMTRISSVVIEGAHTSAGAATLARTLARTVPFWGRFCSPREPTAGPCRGCLLPSATNTAPSRHHLQAVLCDGWDVQTPPSWLLRPQICELHGWS